MWNNCPQSMSMDCEIKFRCDSKLKERFERLAASRRRKTSDMARIVFEDYMQEMEALVDFDSLKEPPTPYKTKPPKQPPL